MAFQVSPGINVSEIDLTTVVPAVSTTVGAIAGVFNWGPAEDRVLVSSENSLIKIFGKPTANNFETFYTAANFLAYGNALYVARAVSDTARNAQATTANTAAVLVKNLAAYQPYQDGNTTPSADVQFIARYPGLIGNSLKISVCDSPAAYSSTLKLTYNLADNVEYDTLGTTSFDTNGATTFSTTFDTKYATGIGTAVKDTTVTTSRTTATQFDTAINTIQTFDVSSGVATITVVKMTNTATISVEADSEAAAAACIQQILNSITEGDWLKFQGVAQYLKVASKGSIGAVDVNEASATITFENKYTGSVDISATGDEVTRFWEFYNVVDRAPGQSDYVAAYGNAAAQDELHVVVVDEDGKFTGSKNTILEVFEGLSRATDAKGQNGKTLYYKDVIANDSEYIYAMTDISASDTAELVESSVRVLPYTKSFIQGVDGDNESDISLAKLAAAYDLFKDKDTVDISLLLSGKADSAVANYLIDNIAENRRDCVVFLSPTRFTSADEIVSYRNGLTSTSFAVMDSGYKYQYDRYNDVYRYIPLNGDVAGLCARTDNLRDPWFSPAGFNRGQIKNIVKLAFNPVQAERDLLYKNGINPVVTFPGQGTVLFGDKTLLTKPSAFDRINVRRLFIVLEKAIATAAKSALFEFNDDFTRAQFRNLVEPYLREIQGRQGITDFKVVCDRTNNTAEVVDRNEFVGDIYVKPARSINFIQLNFVAVRSGVEFNEIVQGA